MLRLFGIQNPAVRALLAAVLLGVGIATGRVVLEVIGGALLVWSAGSLATRRSSDRKPS